MNVGKLFLDGKVLKLKFTRADGRAMSPNASSADFSEELKRVPSDNLNGLAVEFDLERGQPRKIRKAPPPSDFVNPYNFLPAIARDHLSPRNELGDHAPIGHDRLHPQHFTGVIHVELRTETPLLIPDAASMRENADHKTFPIRKGSDGRPYLAPTSIKGMLRSAYEALTNSRLGVFPGKLPNANHSAAGHGARLAMRMLAGDGLSLVPARIEKGVVTLLLGTNPKFPSWDPVRERWEVPGSLQYAAWLPRYLGTPRTYSDTKGLPKHDDFVFCWVQKIQHWRPRRPH